jgi:excisionase family DNA binding protein
MRLPPTGTVDVYEVLRYLRGDYYMGKKEAAEYLAISVSNLEKRLHEVPHFRLGKKVLFKKSELDRWMEQHRENSDSLNLRRLADEAMEALGK